MARYVALFRGINVGKAKRIAMADLRALLTKLGFTQVRTLLNSGNAVFSGATEAPGKLAARLRAAVAAKLGVDALVIVKASKDIDAIVADNALESLATDHSRLLVAMTNDADALTGAKAALKMEWGAERIHVGRHAAYVWCANGILESKALGVLLKSLEMKGTTRNWATLTKIQASLASDNGKK
jgi:uncharacterized protein (DUF1697 family)